MEQLTNKSWLNKAPISRDPMNPNLLPIINAHKNLLVDKDCFFNSADDDYNTIYRNTEEVLK